MRKEKRNKKVVVAMSGGVDSSVVAALLKRANFNVIGVFIKFWAEHKRGELPGLNRCCSPEAEIRARKVAKILKIPFYAIRFEKEFKKKVVDYFLREYKAGRTPNPCVICNKEIKFGLLLEKALSLDTDYIATGHYARIRKFVNSKQIRYSLMTAKDKDKDQSYFLWQLSQNQLSRILFPVGNYTKEEVRKLAKKFGLPVFDAPESQEICFISGKIEDFLKKYLKEKPGNIVDKQGKILGRHRGLWFYTIGQRKGIGLSGGPYFVLDKNIKQNVLIVTKNEKDLYKKELVVKNVNWIHPVKCREAATQISSKRTGLFNRVKAKIRYRHEPASATLYRLNSKVYRLRFDRPQRAITAGQSVVFYSPRSSPTRPVGSRRLSFGEAMVRGQIQELLGGGIICYNK